MYALCCLINAVDNNYLIAQHHEENYHPTVCTVRRYIFAFLWNGTDYLVHGLWADQCEECLTCSYPTCCHLEIPYTEPTNQTFIENWWYPSTKDEIETCGNDYHMAHSLFEHEMIKHGTCIGNGTVTSNDYEDLVASIFYSESLQLQHYMDVQCSGKDENCYVTLDSNFSILNITPTLDVEFDF